MRYRKWGWAIAAGLLGILAALFFLRGFMPSAAPPNLLMSYAGEAVAQAWGAVMPSSAAQRGAREVVILEDDSTASSGAATAQTVPLIANEDAEAMPAALPALVSALALEAASAAATTSATVPVPVPASIQAPPSCIFSFPSSSPPLSRNVIFNEIAWMGSVDAPNGEWMELKNLSAAETDLAGWRILDPSGNIAVTFDNDARIAPNGLLLLAHASATFAGGAAPGKTYAGTMRNTGDDLALIDASCHVSDFVQASAAGWPAGNNTTKQTMERSRDASGWQTSADAGGTPGRESTVPQPPVLYRVSVSFEGSGSAAVASDPSGMACAAGCAGSYASGTKLALRILPGPDTVFAGWSGACSGKGKCALVVSGNMDIVAQIRSSLPVPKDPVPESSSSGPDPEPEPEPGPPPRILVAAVQVAGAAASNDLVKLYNAGSSTVDLGGWKLRKRSSTGGDSSIREFPAGIALLPGQYVTWANSAGGFALSLGAEISSSQTLSANNSVALMDASGTIMDAVAWGSGSAQYGEGPPCPDNPEPGQMLVRREGEGTLIDTGRNADDFIVQ